jgi:AcrR family transcriptional regulator
MSGISARKTIIFREAARMFREKGYHGTTLRELAKRAGVKGASIYHHFSSKQDILYMIMEYTMSNLIHKVQMAIEDKATPLEKLRTAIRFHIVYHTVDMDETYVADAELRSLEPDNLKKIVIMRTNYEKIFKSIMKEGIDAGTMEIDNVSHASKALLPMCTGVSYWYNPEGDQSISEIADSYVNLFCWGVSGKLLTSKKELLS